METLEYYKLLKDQLNIESAYGIAKKLGVTRQCVSKWINKGNTFDDNTAVKVAEILDIPPEIIKIDMETERTKCPKLRTALQKASKVLQGVAASIFIGVLTLSALPHLTPTESNDIYYVK